MSERTYCLFNLHSYCLVKERLGNKLELEFGSVEFVKLYCGLCVKSMYAKSKFKLINRFSVVNTL